MKKKIIFIHGFGVRRDARGLFTDIQKSFLHDEKLKDTEFIFTDLNIIKENGEIILNSLEKQAEIINEVIKKEKEDSGLTIIAHSQDCVVASLMEEKNFEKIFLLAPPTNNDLQRSIERMQNRVGTIINMSGDSKVLRSDGSFMTIPKEYWESRAKINYLESYKNYFEKIEKEKIKIVIANQDEVVENSEESLNVLENLGEIIKINTNHNFTDSRNELLKIIKENF